MKRPLQLSLAIAIALTGTNAMALGLGPVRVMSKLNQPLQAEIPVIQGGAGEAEGLLVSLADQEDFERLGISRSNLGVPLEFSVAKDAQGHAVIRVTSKEPVRSTYLDFLLEVNWPKGRMLREYTVLLDPPISAPASPAPSAVAAAPAATPKAAPARAAEPVPEAPAPAAPKERPVAHAAPATPAPARKVVEGEYGPTKAGETLSSIARETRAAGADANQMMLALLKSNPDAFYRNNINTLKRGVILRVPSADEVKAIGSAGEAAQQVHAQFEDWRGARAATTRVAGDVATPAAAKPSHTETAATAKSPSAAKNGERLALVPPKAGKDSLAMADRPGGGGGSSSINTETAHELARTKEALAASDQATGELKSRVKDLEDIKSKNDKLISLKDSEIAELQQKLKELQTAKATSAPATAAKVPGTAPAGASIDKKDIWGDAGKATASTEHKDAASETNPAVAADKATADHSATATSAPAVASSVTPAQPDAGTAPATAKPEAVDKAIATATTPATPASNAVPAVTTPLPDSTPAEPANASASSATASATSAPAPATPAAKPVPPPTASTKPATTPKPAVTPAAWYDADWVKPAAIGAAVVLLLLGLLGLRKRRAVASAAAAPSIADSFGDSPFDRGPGAQDVMESEAAHLREQIAEDPANLGAHLELLSIYYAERDVARFEEAAAQMREHVADPQQPEWLEAQAMGEELAPHNPLWSATAHEHHEDAFAHADRHADHVESPTHAAFDDTPFIAADHHALDTESFVPAADSSDFEFAVPAAAAAREPAHVVANQGFGFEDIPPLEETYVTHEPVPAASTAPAMSEDFLIDEDAVGTKLDLAKAYMDMGDPDGARSMLEEVVVEGNEAQRAEAQRLIADLR